MACSCLIEKQKLWEKKKLLVTSNFFFSHNVFNSWLLLVRQSEYSWSEGLTHYLLKVDNRKKALKSSSHTAWILRTCYTMKRKEKNCKIRAHVKKQFFLSRHLIRKLSAD